MRFAYIFSVLLIAFNSCFAKCKIAFIAGSDAGGDKINLKTMDTFKGTGSYHWLRLIVPEMCSDKRGYEVTVLSWASSSVDKQYTIV